MDLSLESDLSAFSRIEAVNLILKDLCRLTGMRYSVVARVTETSWTACAAHDEVGLGIGAGDHLELSTTFCNVVRRMDAPLLITHADEDPLFKDHPAPQKYGVQSYIAVPLYRANKEFFGVLCALDTIPNHLGEDSLKTFELMANLISYELEADDQQREREETLRLVEQSNDARARFMGILGHDLRSPLNTIIMGATMQKMGTLNAQQNIDMAERILRTARRMNYLIEDLLDTTQTIQGNEIHIQKKTGDLQDIFLSIIEEFRISNPTRQIEFIQSEVCKGEWDEGRLGQVLANLLSNALYYGSSTSPVVIKLDQHDDNAVLQVTNRGDVISEESRKNLFTPFWRGARKDRGNPNSSGLGLGLYIVKQIINSHGGEIGVKSDQESGTTFTVTLPCSGESKEQAAQDSN